MKVLFLHSDEFHYKVTGETSITKYVTDDILKEGGMSDALVCMIAVEKGDGSKPELIADKAVAEIVAVAGQVNIKSIVLYPYAHLSFSLEAPQKAVQVLNLIYQKALALPDFKVIQAPFGYYKSFEVKVKGHPLSELSRSITVDESEGGAVESSALKAEREIKSEWLIVTPEGEICDAEAFDFSGHDTLRKLFEYEKGGSRVSEEPPPHIALMQEHEMVDYEPGSDNGNMRWYPKGFIIKKLLEDHVTSILAKFGVMQVETPIMYDINHPALSKYLDKFPARQYIVTSDKGDYFLRFAACFGQYMIKHDMQISYNHLPVRLYELTHYSFRKEKSGELVGLKRLRAFTMPDMHTICADVKQAKKELVNQVKLCFNWMSGLDYANKEYAVAIRAVRDFYKGNKDYVRNIAKMAGQPILLELWDKRYFYFVTKFEINYVDNQGKASALSTVQIDVENPERFDITYRDKEDKAVSPLMLHASISGSIDRNLYALLEKQAWNIKHGVKAAMPFWLSPTQVRIIPIDTRHRALAVKLAKSLKARVDIDDRNETLNKRIRAAEKEWVPLTLVIGDKELESGVFPVRVREKSKEEPMDARQLKAYIKEKMGSKPMLPLNLPTMVSMRPKFRG